MRISLRNTCVRPLSLNKPPWNNPHGRYWKIKAGCCFFLACYAAQTWRTYCITLPGRMVMTSLRDELNHPPDGAAGQKTKQNKHSNLCLFFSLNVEEEGLEATFAHLQLRSNDTEDEFVDNYQLTIRGATGWNQWFSRLTELIIKGRLMKKKPKKTQPIIHLVSANCVEKKMQRKKRHKVCP